MANLLPTIHLLAPVRLVMGLLIPARLVVLDMVDFIFYGVGGCEITCIVVLQQIGLFRSFHIGLILVVWFRALLIHAFSHVTAPLFSQTSASLLFPFRFAS